MPLVSVVGRNGKIHVSLLLFHFSSNEAMQNIKQLLSVSNLLEKYLPESTYACVYILKTYITSVI